MTVEAMVSARDSEVSTQATPVLPVAVWDVEGNFHAEQVDAIIRAWRGQAVGQDVPLSPVGEWDVDGTLSLGKSNVSDFITEPTAWPCDTHNGCPEPASWYCSYEC